MTMNIEQKLQQLEDRIAIRELIDQYTYCADTRDAQGQMAIFTEDTNFEVYMDEKLPAPTQVVTGRKNLFPVFDDLNHIPFNDAFQRSEYSSSWMRIGQVVLPTAGLII